MIVDSKLVGKCHAEMSTFVDCLKIVQNATDCLMEQSKTGCDVSGPKKK